MVQRTSASRVRTVSLGAGRGQEARVKGATEEGTELCPEVQRKCAKADTYVQASNAPLEPLGTTAGPGSSCEHSPRTP